MRMKSKVVLILPTVTENQIESALDNHLNNGWEFVGIFQVGSNFFAILKKIIAQ